MHTIEDRKIIYKFNFYKKKFKKINKNLNLLLKIKYHVSDNLGYLYALDYNKKQVVRAKNYKIPFRSNIKIVNNKNYIS